MTSLTADYDVTVCRAASLRAVGQASVSVAVECVAVPIVGVLNQHEIAVKSNRHQLQDTAAQSPVHHMRLD